MIAAESIKNKDNRDIQQTILMALIPLVLLVALVYMFVAQGPSKIFPVDIPPIEELHVTRHILQPDRIILEVINTGQDPSTLAQVMVRGAFWYHEVYPQRELAPFQSAHVIIPYPWVEGEPYEIILLSSTGLTFDYEIEVALPTPQVTMPAIIRFALLGIYVGVIPVALGICWFPFLRRLSQKYLDFLLYLTAGLLVFLVFDAITEGLELAESIPSVFHGSALLALGMIGTYLILMGIDTQARINRKQNLSALFVSWLVAFGIGLHNLAEGLAIGSSYVLGEISLGAMLVIGFTLHNATEGIAIVAPILKERVKISRLIGLGLLAGAPTILGCWIGAFTYSQILSLLFLGIGAGAILQVIGIIIGNKPLTETLKPLNICGLLGGYLLMYATGLLVGGS